MLQLEKPLAFIDIESTGTNKETDRIIELAIIILNPDGSEIIKCKRFNPGMPIPAESTAIHGIKDEDVAMEPPFSKYARSIHDVIMDCDIAGFGSNFFDVPLLHKEFSRSGIYWDYTKVNFIDVGNIFKIQEPRTLSAAVKFYTGEDHSDAHSAEADVKATIAVFKKQLERYELPSTVKELYIFSNYGKPILDLSGKFTYDETGNIILNFGPHRGKVAKDHPDFIDWMLNKADFPTDTNEVCRKILSDYYANQTLVDADFEDE